MSLFGCESICQLVTHTWKRTKAAARSESVQGPGARAACFPSWLAPGFFGPCLAFLHLKSGDGRCAYGCLGSLVNVWKMLSEESQLSGSRVETLQLSALAIVCSC